MDWSARRGHDARARPARIGRAFDLGDESVVIVGVEPADIADLSAGVGVEGSVVERPRRARRASASKTTPLLLCRSDDREHFGRRWRASCGSPLIRCEGETDRAERAVAFAPPFQHAVRARRPRRAPSRASSTGSCSPRASSRAMRSLQRNHPLEAQRSGGNTGDSGALQQIRVQGGARGPPDPPPEAHHATSRAQFLGCRGYRPNARCFQSGPLLCQHPALFAQGRDLYHPALCTESAPVETKGKIIWMAEGASGRF